MIPQLLWYVTANYDVGLKPHFERHFYRCSFVMSNALNR